MSAGHDPDLGTTSEPADSSEPPRSQPVTRADRRAVRRDRRAVHRSALEQLLLRLIATCGVVAIGVAIAAIMHSSGSEGWLIGLVVSGVSVVMAGVIWSARGPRV